MTLLVENFKESSNRGLLEVRVPRGNGKQIKYIPTNSKYFRPKIKRLTQ